MGLPCPPAPHYSDLDGGLVWEGLQLLLPPDPPPRHFSFGTFPSKILSTRQPARMAALMRDHALLVRVKRGQDPQETHVLGVLDLIPAVGGADPDQARVFDSMGFSQVISLGLRAPELTVYAVIWPNQ